MAEQSEENEKSEDPTQKRLDDALKRGDVAKSQEVNTWFVIAGGTLVLEAPLSPEMKDGFARFGFDEQEADPDPFGRRRR